MARRNDDDVMYLLAFFLLMIYRWGEIWGGGYIFRDADGCCYYALKKKKKQMELFILEKY